MGFGGKKSYSCGDNRRNGAAGGEEEGSGEEKGGVLTFLPELDCDNTFEDDDATVDSGCPQAGKLERYKRSF